HLCVQPAQSLFKLLPSESISIDTSGVCRDVLLRRQGPPGVALQELVDFLRQPRNRHIMSPLIGVAYLHTNELTVAQPGPKGQTPSPLLHILAEFDVPVGEVEEVLPAIVRDGADGDVDERTPLRPLRL